MVVGELGDVAGWEGALALGVVAGVLGCGAGWWEEMFAVAEVDGVEDLRGRRADGPLVEGL